jgi:hypothetical protein
MTDEDAIDDDIEDSLEEDEDEDTDVVDSDDGLATASKATEVIDDFSIAARQRLRDELEDQVAAFLARGGQIHEIPPNATADPPKKPTPDYGGRPI